MFKTKSENYWAIITISHKRLVDERKKCKQSHRIQFHRWMCKKPMIPFLWYKMSVVIFGHLPYEDMVDCLALFWQLFVFFKRTDSRIGFCSSMSIFPHVRHFKRTRPDESIVEENEKYERYRKKNIRLINTHIATHFVGASWTSTRKQNWKEEKRKRKQRNRKEMENLSPSMQSRRVAQKRAWPNAFTCLNPWSNRQSEWYDNDALTKGKMFFERKNGEKGLDWCRHC